MKMQAIWNDAVIAESDQTIMVEGNHYFPPDAVNRKYFAQSERHTVCPWKGVASYYDVVVNGAKNPGAAWYYPDASEAARSIQNYVAFWQGVQVRQVD